MYANALRFEVLLFAIYLILYAMIYLIFILLAAFFIWMVIDAKHSANLSQALKAGKFGKFSLTRHYALGDTEVAIDETNLQLAFLRVQVLHENSIGELVILDRSFVCNMYLLEKIAVTKGKKMSTVEFYFSENLPERNIQKYVWSVCTHEEIAKLISAEFTKVEYEERIDPRGL